MLIVGMLQLEVHQNKADALQGCSFRDQGSQHPRWDLRVKEGFFKGLVLGLNQPHPLTFSKGGGSIQVVRV